MKIYEPKAGLTEDTGKAKADPKASATTGAIVSSIGEGLAGLGEHFQKLRDSQQHMAAENLLSKASDEFSANLQKDPDTWGKPEKIDQFFSEAVDNAGQTITSPEARMMFHERASTLISEKRHQALVSVMREQSQLYKGTYVDTQDRLANEYILSSDPQTMSNKKSQMQELAMEAVNHRGVNAAWAQTHLRANLNSLAIRKLKSDLGGANQTDDPIAAVKMAEDELKKGADGKYRDLLPEQKESAWNLLRMEKTRAEKTAPERERVVRHLYDKRLTAKYAENSLTEEDLIHAQNRMTPTRFDLLAKNLLSGNMKREHNPETYSAMINFISDEKNSEEEIVNRIIQDENSGNLSPKEAHDITKMFMVTPEEDAHFKLPKRPQMDEMLSAQENLSNQTRQKSVQTKSWWKMLTDYFGNNKKGATEAAKSVVKNHSEEQTKSIKNAPDWGHKEARKMISLDLLSKYPEIAKYPKEGVIRTDKFGNRARVYSDGSYEEVAE